jgi:exodeoxyribonuclease-3
MTRGETTLKIATWNVNSLRARLPHVQRWISEKQPAILALQETKVEDADFPHAPLEGLGYAVVFSGQKSYNGVAVLARQPLPLEVIATALPGLEDPARRVLAVRVGGLCLVNLYVPNGEALDSAKFPYKLAWLTALEAYLATLLRTEPRLLVVGDFNIAPEDRDCHDPAAWAGSCLVSPAERAALARLAAQGFVDLFRQFPQPEGTYSWWDYRAAGFRRNLGLRIDLLLGAPALLPSLRAAGIDRAPRGWERPSDHAPAWIEIDFPSPPPAMPEK